MKKLLKKGSGEILGFLYSLPIILLILYLTVDIIRIGAVKERLEYTTYKAARAAAVCKNIEDATKQANKTAFEDITKSGLIKYLDETDPKFTGLKFVKIEYADGKGMDSQGKSAGTKKGSKADKERWEKGSFIICTATLNVKSLILPGSKPAKSASMVMMIEAIDEEDSTYPWFKGL